MNTKKKSSKSTDDVDVNLPIKKWPREYLIDYVECLSDQLNDASDDLLFELTESIRSQGLLLHSLGATDKEIEQAILDGFVAYRRKRPE